MNKIIYISILIFYGLGGNAQTEELQDDYTHFVKILLAENNLYGLDKTGHLHIWNLATLEKEYVSLNSNDKYSSINKNSFNEIYLGTDLGTVHKLNKKDYSTSLHLQLKRTLSVTEILFNSKNEMFLIVPTGVYDPIRNKNWANFKHQPNGMIVRKRFLFIFKKRTDRYFQLPQYTFIDSQDRIWMIRSFGEFGGALQLFDTKERKEILANIENLNFGSIYPKSVFEDHEQNIYITSGLQHFMNFGEIYQIEGNVASMIYESEDFIDTTKTNFFEGGIFVGPGEYNSYENKLYFATTEGFYRSAIPDKGRIKNPELLFTPKLMWERERLAIGVGMAVKKIEFTNDNRLVFLTSNNGIGVYAENKLIMLK